MLEAALNNDIETAIELTRQGANISQKDWTGNNSIQYAIQHNSYGMLEALFENTRDYFNIDELFTVSNRFIIICLI